MKKRLALVALVLVSSLAQAEEKPDGVAAQGTCLLAVARCIAKGSGNFHLYEEFSHREILVAKGDVLEYQVYLAPGVPEPKVSIDVNFGGPTLRDSSAKDQNGLRAHADADLSRAVGKWYARRIPLDGFVGRKTTSWSIAFEGDKEGLYAVFFRDVAVRRADGSRIAIYDGGRPEANTATLIDGYSRYVVAEPVSLAVVGDGNALSALIKGYVARQEVLDQVETVRASLPLLRQLLDVSPAAARQYASRINDVERSLADLAANRQATRADAKVILDRARDTLAPLGVLARQWTGHLVGHAHIDMQWLWEYPETVAEFGHTFGQAVKFMEEYPEFTFTQSSAAFYQGTEAAYPALFAKIKKYVAEGRWELVGGRICEGDTNIISAEAHARHFLYGQRYFRERFHKQAVVGWEPDTFGHNWQMPQILKLGGCKYYYFCRAGNGRGQGSPLFWWSGPDGSRVLTFEEPVISGWYNCDPITRQLFGELSEMTKRTGSHDELWVYGVGNHGGGPTRESITTALAWRREPYLPQVKFSTAQAFFEAQGPDVLKRLPVVNDELNSVFEGCYTTHGNIKRWNNDSQAALVSAETAAAVAHRFGFNYPGLLFRQCWEDVCWNHHHDTIDGSAQHASYRKSQQMLDRVISRAKRTGQEAVAFLAGQVMPNNAGRLLVFNPVGADCDAVVSCTLPPNTTATQMRGDGDGGQLQVIDPQKGEAIFAAHKLPSIGYRVYQPATGHSPSRVSVSNDGTRLENETLRLVLDAKSGVIRSLFDKRSQRELIPAGQGVNRLEVHWERPNDMPAWNIGAIDHVEKMEAPVELKVVESGPVRCTVEWTRRILASTVTQRVSLVAGGRSVPCTVHIDWRETGSGHPLWPFLKLAFDLDLRGGAATYEIPFGTIRRPTDGHEAPAVHWADLGTSDYGVSLINDCKHGYSMTGNTMRLSLVRTPTSPDNTSDNYPQSVRYEIYPHRGTWQAAGTVHRAAALLQPPLAAWVPGDAHGPLPGECSFVRPRDDRAVITAVKRAEDDDDLVVRLYESSGSKLTAPLALHWPVASGTEVNFMEDDLGSAPTAAVDGREVSLRLRGAEIQTVKLRLQGDPAIPLRGTRGPGGVRQF